MPEESPSNAVLLAKLESMAAVVLANQTMNHETDARLLEQVTRTNGRVTNLEKAKNMGLGALLLINVLVVPIVIALILNYLNYLKK